MWNLDRELVNAGICSQLRGDWGMKEEPDEPPQELTDEQIETCNREFAKRGLQIIRGSGGRLGIVRML